MRFSFPAVSTAFDRLFSSKVLLAAPLALGLALATPGCADDTTGGGGSNVEVSDQFMTTCDINDDQCPEESGEFCFEYGDKGVALCTRDCSSSDDCPAPSDGCNGKGVCKAPKE